MLPTTRTRAPSPFILLLSALGLSACSDSPTLAGGAEPTGPSELAASSIQVIDGGLQEGEVAAYLAEPLVIEVRSAGGAALTNVPVEWTFRNGRGISASDADYGAADTKMISYTDGRGRAAAVWQLGTTAGQQLGSVEIVVEDPPPTGSQNTGNGNGKENKGRIDFTAKAKPAKPTAIEVSPDGVVLRAEESVELTADPVDAYGNPVADTKLNWQSSDESVAVVDNHGRVMALGPGSVNISARSGNVRGEVTVSVVSATGGVMQKVGGDKQAARVGTRLPADLTVLLLDGDGAPVPDATVTWSVRSGGGRLSSSTSRTGSQGRARITWTLGETSGRQLVEASASGVPDVTFEATASPGPIASLEVTPGQSSLTVGENLALTVEGSDEFGNILRNLSVSWSSNAGTVASVTSTGVISARSGGAATITASTSGLTARHNVTVQEATQDLRRVRGNGQSGPVGRTLSESLAVRLIDGAGNGVSGETVRWRVRSGGGSLSSNSVTTDAQGEASVRWTLGESTGRQEIVAEADGASALVFYANGTPGPVARLDVSPGSSTMTVGGSTQLSADAWDEFGNFISNPSVQWSSSANGVATVTSAGRVNAVGAGTATIRATSNGVSDSHSTSVGEPVTPGTGEFNEPDDFRAIVDEDWANFSDVGWYHVIKDVGNVETRNNRLIWTYQEGMSGGFTPGGKVVKDHFDHGPYQYQRDQGVVLSNNFHGHQSGVNKFRYWSTGNRARAYIAFFGPDNTRLTLGINVGGWAMGAAAWRWNSSNNYASPTLEQATVTRGVPHTIETLIYVGTSGRSDGWVKAWLNGVLILDFRNIAILDSSTPPVLEQIHFAPVWGGMGDVLPATQTLTVDHTYVSVKR